MCEHLGVLLLSFLVVFLSFAFALLETFLGGSWGPLGTLLGPSRGPLVRSHFGSRPFWLRGLGRLRSRVGEEYSLPLTVWGSLPHNLSTRLGSAGGLFVPKLRSHFGLGSYATQNVVLLDLRGLLTMVHHVLLVVPFTVCAKNKAPMVHI